MSDCAIALGCALRGGRRDDRRPHESHLVRHEAQDARQHLPHLRRPHSMPLREHPTRAVHPREIDNTRHTWRKHRLCVYLIWVRKVK